jgi:GTP-binding protein HflX
MPRERAILVTVQLDPRFVKAENLWPVEEEAAELKELASSSGCEVVGEVIARRHQPVAGTFLGEGKLDEIAGLASHSRGQAVIFSHELSPAQQRNIEEQLGVKTIDRTQLILDIFAQRAKSREGKVQVERAQLQYLLPRLTGKGIMLSRLGGGIGTRGPGEQKLEMDRRRIRTRLSRLDQELAKLGERRAAIRSRRKETEVPVVALVGYTNAGKTTLLNRLTKAAAVAKHQLFTTLDPLARRLRLPDGETVVLTDTVGFLHHLPHGLIESFKATLEEARDADLLLHVLDASQPLIVEQAEAVERVLDELDLLEKPRLTVLNKQDQVADAAQVASLVRQFKPSVAISAKTGQGIEELTRRIEDQLRELLVAPSVFRVPIERADVLARLHQAGQVLQRETQDSAIRVVARVSSKLRSELKAFLT